MTDQETAAAICIPCIIILAVIGGLFLRWLLGGLERPYGAPDAEGRSLSPIQRFVAGGGDMSTPGVAALLMSAEESWNRNHDAKGKAHR